MTGEKDSMGILKDILSQKLFFGEGVELSKGPIRVIFFIGMFLLIIFSFY